MDDGTPPRNRSAVANRFRPEFSLLALLGAKVRILHGPSEGMTTLASGGDIDCEVVGLDLRWPLRVPPKYRVVQAIHYDVGGWAWVVELDGAFAIIDAIDDDAGINRLGFATLAGNDVSVSDARRAAYLTAKRIWKRQLDPVRWDEIRKLAFADLEEFSIALTGVFGSGIAMRMRRQIEAGLPPGSSLWLAARATQALRRFDSPDKAISLIVRSAARVIERVLNPTGLFIFVLSPVSVQQRPIGVSALADRLRGPLMRYRAIGGRASSRERAAADGSRAAPPTPARAWPELLTHVFAIWWYRVAKGLILFEDSAWSRWSNMVPDVSSRSTVARVLSSVMPKPDITVVVETSGRAHPDESVVVRAARTSRVLCRVDADRLAAVAGERALQLLESRVLARLGGGWIECGARDASFLVPRGPRSATRSALNIHERPTANRVVSAVSQIAAEAGMYRIFPRTGKHPPAEVRRALAEFVPARSTLSVARTSHHDRYIAAAIAETGAVHWVAKVATSSSDADGIGRERAYLDRVAGLDLPLHVPRVIAYRDGVLLLEPLDWVRPRGPWCIPDDVAYSLGRIFRLVPSLEPSTGLVHGDCGPLNLRRAARGWVLLDWERASDDGTMLDDVFTYVLSAKSILGRPDSEEVVQALLGRGRLGHSIEAYLHGAEARVDDLRASFISFLERRLSPSSSAPVLDDHTIKNTAARLLEVVRT